MKKHLGILVLLMVFIVVVGCSVENEEEGMAEKDTSLEEEIDNENEHKDGENKQEAESTERRVPSKDDHVEEEEIELEPWEAPDLTGKKILVLIAEGFHDTETTVPIDFLERLGAVTTLAGPEIEEVGAYNSRVTLQVEIPFYEVDIEEYDALLIPGGRSPMLLSNIEEVVEFTKNFLDTRKPIASICQGPRLLIATKDIDGKTLTAATFMEDDLVNAGAVFHNEPVVIDDFLITSRDPGDLPLFNRAIADMLSGNPNSD